ncbi:PIG-L family deacetylase [Microbacterium sp. 69-10]|uniref:PIG-L family deacetylase n=1 Tax=Microbacterium sp. 69-10 TaxID=1895783 RepID=UPI0025E01638|nr:PIG-L family deacetylase [Microbacterium sp. 69-10]
MSRVRAPRWLMLAFVAVLSIALAACGEYPDPTSVPVSTPTRTPAPTNTLTAEQIALIRSTCPAGLPSPAGPHDDPLRRFPQWGADALTFAASTKQCGDAPLILSRMPQMASAGTTFSSPLQYIDRPCSKDTLVSYWAHYDDDLIFGNPPMQGVLDAGSCVRSLYFTLSDAGRGASQYATEREIGLRRAYDVMRGASSSPWVDRTLTLRSGLRLTLTYPQDDPRITLMFLRLPDGSRRGTGYEATGWQSLPKLVSGQIATMTTLDGAQTVTLSQLRQTVVELARAYAPTTILTSLPSFAEGSKGDHPDHSSVGRIVAEATDAGLLDVRAVTYAVGYPGASLPANLSGELLDRKLKAFVAYAAHDSMIRCSTPQQCLVRIRFGDWLQRHYQQRHDQLVRSSSG